MPKYKYYDIIASAAVAGIRCYVGATHAVSLSAGTYAHTVVARLARDTHTAATSAIVGIRQEVVTA